MGEAAGSGGGNSVAGVSWVGGEGKEAEQELSTLCQKAITMAASYL